MLFPAPCHLLDQTLAPRDGVLSPSLLQFSLTSSFPWVPFLLLSPFPCANLTQRLCRQAGMPLALLLVIPCVVVVSVPVYGDWDVLKGLASPLCRAHPTLMSHQ